MPAHSVTAGSIVLEEAYAASKMLNSASWNGLLRSKITPSDVDLCFDNNGAVLFADFSIACADWRQLARTLRGQRRLYEALIRTGPHCAVVCKHGVTPDMRRHIDTLHDVEQFQAMVWDFEPVLSPVYDGCWWQAFVMKWVNEPSGPLRIRRHVLGLETGLIRPRSRSAPPTGDS